jgi:exodeoxyribonuclease V alpha subunit
MRRSAWNAADVRGEVEQLIARRNVVDARIRTELAEDLTARAVRECVALVTRDGVPENIRALTSPHVVAVEGDLTRRLAVRAEHAGVPMSATVTRDAGLDPAQRDTVRALAGTDRLIVIEGAAGAGKTTVLAETRRALEPAGQRLIVVTATRKAALVAAQQVGTDAFSAAWLAHQHGWRWDTVGNWRRLEPGQIDPKNDVRFDGPGESARLRRGDLLLVDEAGMLDQDTARALLTIADEAGARLALIGDRHQLPAVGRGGVLELAARHVHPDAHLTLDTVHRFTRSAVTPEGVPVSEPDHEYAALSLAMRIGDDPASVFDALLDRGQIQVHGYDADRLATLAESAADAVVTGHAGAVVADTREQVAALNTAIRERLVAAGAVSDDTVAATAAGERISVGDRVATRRNDTALEVANRDQWTVTAVHSDGGIAIAGAHGGRILPPEYVRAHVELAYASTVHGAQGDTTTTAHVVIGEHSSAAATYVGMTRGRENNVAHLVAETVEDARQQWIAVFGRDRADLGPAHAAQLAAREAERYAPQRPLDDVLNELRQAWTVEANTQTRLTDARRRRDLLRDIVAVSEQRDDALPELHRAYMAARAAAASTAARLQDLEPVVGANAADLAASLKADWGAQRQSAREAAQTVIRSTGRLGRRRGAVHDARVELEHWSASWHSCLPSMPTDSAQVVRFAAWFDDTLRHHAHFDAYARSVAEYAHPEYSTVLQAADDAREQERATLQTLRQAEQHYSIALQHYGALGHADDPAGRLADVERAIAVDETTLANARGRIAALRAEPTLRAKPGEVIDVAQADWAATRQERAVSRAVRAGIEREGATTADTRRPSSVPGFPVHETGPSISR